jgi:hypothetical protein
VLIVGHGRSSAKAVRNAIAMASRFASANFVRRAEDDLAAATLSAAAYTGDASKAGT